MCNQTCISFEDITFHLTYIDHAWNKLVTQIYTVFPNLWVTWEPHLNLDYDAMADDLNISPTIKLTVWNSICISILYFDSCEKIT